MGRKERGLSRLNNKELLRLAKSVSGSGVSSETSRQQLLKIVKEHFSVMEIEGAIPGTHSQKRRYEAFLLASIILCSSFVGISASLVSESRRVAATTYPGIEWSTTLLNDQGVLYSVQQTSDGGYILLGSQSRIVNVNGSPWSTTECKLIKTDSNGTVQWTRVYADGLYCKASSIMQTRDLGYVMAGGTLADNGAMTDAWLWKINANGDSEWKKSYCAGRACCAQQISDGGYVVVGVTQDNALFWLLKTDSDGNEQWNRTYNMDQYLVVQVIQQVPYGGYLMAGIGPSCTWLVKTDLSGNIQWYRMFEEMEGWEVSVGLTSDGGCVVIGLSHLYPTTCAIVKVDRYGNVQWNRAYQSSAFDSLVASYSIQQTLDGGYISAGHSLLKLDPRGNQEWEVVSYTGTTSQPSSVEQTSDGGYIVGGYEYITFWLVKLEGSTQQYSMSTHLAVFAVVALALVASTVFLGIRQRRRLKVEIKEPAQAI